MIDTLIAGDTLQFDTVVTDYPATDGWTLTYKLIPRAAGAVITFNAAANGSGYRTTQSNTTTAAWAAGEYSWAAYVVKAGERHTVDSGACTIKPDPGVVSLLDSRSHAQKVLEAIKAVLEKRASSDQQEYTIHGRSLKRTPLADLLKLRATYENEVRNDEAAARLAAGLQVGHKIQVRF